MFIYKSQPRFHRFYDHNQLHIELETHSCIKPSFQAVWDYIKNILIFDFATLTTGFNCIFFFSEKKERTCDPSRNNYRNLMPSANLDEKFVS